MMGFVTHFTLTDLLKGDILCCAGELQQLQAALSAESEARRSAEEALQRVTLERQRLQRARDELAINLLVQLQPIEKLIMGESLSLLHGLHHPDSSQHDGSQWHYEALSEMHGWITGSTAACSGGRGRPAEDRGADSSRYCRGGCTAGSPICKWS